MQHYLVVGFLGVLLVNTYAQVDINTQLTHYTFKIEGPAKKPDTTTYGTIFLMGIRNTNTLSQGSGVFITAAHVLEDISGSTAKIFLRRKVSGGTYEKVPFGLTIRNEGKPLWVRHPEVDVAVMPADSLPQFVKDFSTEIPLPSIGLLANDAKFEKYEIHIGDELLCLGYPFGIEANASGFPILRSGRIASFPLTPASDVRSFLFDFEVFSGNSGGPVYFVESNRTYGKQMRMGETLKMLVGVVSQQQYHLSKSVKTEVSLEGKRWEIAEKREALALAIVVPAHFIEETVALLNQE